MDLNKILKRNKKILKQKGFDNYDFEAGSILAFVLKKPREFLFAHPEYEIGLPKLLKNEVILRRRLRGVPLSYLTGYREFFGMDFKVNKNVLVPRPETELMVEQALRIYREYGAKTFLDVGTGSGCVISVLALKVPDADFIALDISKKALSIARLNAKRHRVDKRIRFVRSNLIREVMQKSFRPPMVILANLPYLTDKQIEDSPTIKKEPRLALAGGEEGLDHYHLLFKQIRACRLTRPLFVLCEIDEGQARRFKSIAESELPSASIDIKKDLSSAPRLAIIKLSARKGSDIPRIRS